MHLAFSFIAKHNLVTDRFGEGRQRPRFNLTNIDDHIFYSVPTSFFVMDDRIPKVIRELITEAEGSRKMNFLTGASACARKAVYEFLVKEQAEGDSYEDEIKSLKKRFANVDPELFDVRARSANCLRRCAASLRLPTRPSSQRREPPQAGWFRLQRAGGDRQLGKVGLKPASFLPAFIRSAGLQ